jgi:hypothetical protein
MPENSFERIGPSSGVDRVGSGNDVGPDRSVTARHDPTFHEPLAWHISGHGVLPPAPQPPPAPTPTEDELREELAATIEAKRERECEFARAESAHERAELHLAKCTRQLAEFADLDAVIAEATVTALRCDAGRLSAGLSEEMELCLADRERARTELTAAKSAASIFLHERAAAAQALGTASRNVDVLVARILAFEAEALAATYEAVQAKAKVICAALVSFDAAIATPSKITVPGAVRGVYNGIDSNEFVRLLNSELRTVWRTAADALRDDPGHVVELALPDAPPAPPPLRTMFPPLVHAVPIKRDADEEAA